jgi:hypothetical protein
MISDRLGGLMSSAAWESAYSAAAACRLACCTRGSLTNMNRAAPDPLGRMRTLSAAGVVTFS